MPELFNHGRNLIEVLLLFFSFALCRGPTTTAFVARVLLLLLL
jgi:hypothetical protein